MKLVATMAKPDQNVPEMVQNIKAAARFSNSETVTNCIKLWDGGNINYTTMQ